jgi:hypothetical protein
VHRPGVPCHSGFLCVPLKGQTECVGLSRLYILQEPSVKAEVFVFLASASWKLKL